MLTIYIHGFGGSGQGNKANLFREYYKSINKAFLAPSLSYIPDLAISTLQEIIELHNRKVTLIGSSLGGYISIYLAHQYNLKTILINPAVNTPVTLEKYLGEAPNFYDESRFEWNQNHIEMLKRFDISRIDGELFMTLLQMGDKILDCKEAETKLKDSKLVIENGGNHSFEGIEKHFKEIEKFLG
jgi:predicted esterase YcpF (UPF0227 family)